MSLLTRIKTALGFPTFTRQPAFLGLGGITHNVALYVGTPYTQGYVAGCAGAAIRGMLDCQSQGLAPARPTWIEMYGKVSMENLREIPFNSGVDLTKILNYVDYGLNLVDDVRYLSRELKAGERQYNTAARAIRHLVEQERPVGISVMWTTGMVVPAHFKPKSGPRLSLVEWKGPHIDPNGRPSWHCVFIHARILHPDLGPLIAIRNSDGRDWGDGGSAWMQEQEFCRMFDCHAAYGMRAEAFTFSLKPLHHWPAL